VEKRTGVFRVKILFIATSLEPGRDGVGDYTRLLSEECERQGHSVFCIALNDPFIGADAKPDSTTLRLSSSLPWDERVNLAERFIRERGPDWISLQFVAYGFQPRGFVGGLQPGFVRLLRHARAHLMFHEIWIGAAKQAGFKDRVIGVLQKFMILRMARAVDVKSIHTTNEPYRRILKEAGLPAKRLGLFSSTPVFPPARDEVFSELKKAGCPVDLESRGEVWLFGMFGSLHPVWPPEPLLTRLVSIGKKTGRKPVIISSGRLGPREDLWKSMARSHPGEINFVRLGERSAEFVSRLFQEIDFGIATTPLSLIEKSASVATMLDHGLPVIVNRDDVHFGNHPCSVPDKRLIALDESFEQRFLAARKSGAKSALPEAAAQFLTDLTSLPQ
jgi:hypothetical protein